MSELSQDEVSVLLIAREGQFLAPIARWQKPILALADRGLMKRYDDVNYGITDAGRQAIEQRDQQDFDDLRAAQSRVVERALVSVQVRIEEVLRKYNIVLPEAPLEALTAAMERIIRNRTDG